MKKLSILLVSLFAALGCFGQGTGTRTQITVTVTNLPQNNLSTIVINGTTLYWTNATSAGNGYITIGVDNGTSATNLWAQLSSQILTGPILPGSPGAGNTATNATLLTGGLNQSMAVVLSGTGTSAGWGFLTTNVQTFTNQTPVIIPFYAYAYPPTRTNVASNVMAGMIAYAPFGWPVSIITNNWAGSDFSNATWFNTTISNSVETNDVSYNSTNYNSYSTNAVLTNSTENGSILVNPVATNGINFGNSFSSAGSGSSSQAFGKNATATGVNALSLGITSRATNGSTVSIGQLPVAGGEFSIAIGFNAEALSNSDVSIGSGSEASGPSATAVGTSAMSLGTNSTSLGSSATTGTFVNSTALGFSATSTANNQIMLGSAGVSVVVNNNETVSGNVTITGVQTNTTFDGTNNNRGDWAWQQTNNTALANGNNADVNIGRAVYIKVSGPSSAFAIVGVAGGRDGRHIFLQNSTAQTWTVLNNSGVDSTAANRILTGINGTITMTNNPGWCEMIYDATVPGWCVINHSF